MTAVVPPWDNENAVHFIASTSTSTAGQLQGTASIGHRAQEGYRPNNGRYYQDPTDICHPILAATITEDAARMSTEQVRGGYLWPCISFAIPRRAR